MSGPDLNLVNVLYGLYRSHEDLVASVFPKIKKIVDYAFINIPFYKHHFSSVGYRPGDLKTIEDIQALPVLTKEKLRRAIDSKTILPINADPSRLSSVHTTGSTGRPLTLYLDRYAILKRLQITLKGYHLMGCTPWSKSLLVWRKKKPDKIAKIKSFFGRCKYVSVMDVVNLAGSALTSQKLHDIVAEVQRFNPDVIRGYVSALYVMARFAKMHNIKIRPKSIVCCAEYLPHHIWDELKEIFKCSVVNLYGASETPLVALSVDDVSKRMFLFDDNYWVELIDEDGKTVGSGIIGNMLITVCYLKSMPLIRYKLGDIAEFDGHCYGPFRTLKEIYGRTNDIFVLPGRRIFFSHNWHIYFRDVPGLERFEVVQQDIDKITIRLLPYDKKLLSSGLDKVQRLIAESLGPDILINWNIEERLQLDAGEKFRAVKSNLDWKEYI